MKNRIGVIISDVMGHGASAALVTVFIKTVLTEHQEHIKDDPAQLLQILNTRFSDIISSRIFMFATAFCGIFDQAKKQLICANAGHPSPFLQHGTQSECELVTDKQTGNGLGIKKESIYENCYYLFDDSSRIFLYTDGVYEVKNVKGEEFTIEQLQKVVSTTQHETSEKLIQSVSNAITEFNSAAPNEDDLTLIAIQR